MNIYYQKCTAHCISIITMKNREKKYVLWPTSYEMNKTNCFTLHSLQILFLFIDLSETNHIFFKLKNIIFLKYLTSLGEFYEKWILIKNIEVVLCRSNHFHNCIEEQREQKCGKIYQWTKYKENNCTSCIINKK